MVKVRNVRLKYLDHHAPDALKTHSDDGLGALLGGGSASVPDGVLRLQAEQEAGSEAVDVVDTRRPTRVWHQVLRIQVPVSVCDQPPDARKREPRQEERQCEHQDGPAPLDVHQGCEQVLQTQLV